MITFIVTVDFTFEKICNDYAWSLDSLEEFNCSIFSNSCRMVLYHLDSNLFDCGGSSQRLACIVGYPSTKSLDSLWAHSGMKVDLNRLLNHSSTKD